MEGSARSVLASGQPEAAWISRGTLALPQTGLELSSSLAKAGAVVVVVKQNSGVMSNAVRISLTLDGFFIVLL